MKIDCPCGFSGTSRPYKTLVGAVAKCYGCNKMYTQNGKGEVVELTEMPQFETYEQLEEFLKSVPKEAKGSKTPTGKSRSKRKPAEVDTSKKLVSNAPSVPVFKTIHFYVRPADTFDQVRKDGREEMKYAGPGTLVFCHDHKHYEPCNPSCREA